MTVAVIGDGLCRRDDHASLIDDLATVRRMKADLDAYEFETLAAIAAQSDPYADGTDAADSKHFVGEDVAAALRITSGSAREQLECATRVRTLFEASLQFVRDGLLPGYYVRRLAEDTAFLPDPAAVRIEALVLPKAPDQTYGQFCSALRRAIRKHDQRPTVEQQEQARGNRKVRFGEPDETGMTELWALLPADEAATMAARIEAVAHAWKGDGRTRDQREADALMALTTGTGHLAAPVKATVNVVVSLSTLLGVDDEPGELDSALIPAELARAIAHDPTSTWRRLVTDEHRNLIDVSSASYRPPAAMGRLIELRNPVCAFPTCGRPARRCEKDHVRCWADGGTTCPGNLLPLCTRHHHLKHDGNWRLWRQHDGTVQWRSPTGQTYRKPPPEPLPRDQTLDPPPF